MLLWLLFIHTADVVHCKYAVRRTPHVYRYLVLVIFKRAHILSSPTTTMLHRKQERRPLFRVPYSNQVHSNFGFRHHHNWCLNAGLKMVERSTCHTQDPCCVQCCAHTCSRIGTIVFPCGLVEGFTPKVNVQFFCYCEGVVTPAAYLLYTHSSYDIIKADNSNWFLGLCIPLNIYGKFNISEKTKFQL